MGRRPKDPLSALAVAARAQLKRAEKLGASLDERLKVKQRASEEWSPDEDWRRDFMNVNTTIKDAGNSLIRALDGHKKDLGNLTEEQLVAQMKAEVQAAAASMTDAEWQAMVDARAKKRS